jgi:hypothetical protein
MLRAFEGRAIGRIFGTKMEAIEFWRKWYYDEFYHLYSSPVIRTIKSWDVRRET